MRPGKCQTVPKLRPVKLPATARTVHCALLPIIRCCTLYRKQTAVKPVKNELRFTPLVCRRNWHNAPSTNTPFRKHVAVIKTPKYFEGTRK